MPKLWNVTVEKHRHAVHDATLDATAQLLAERGLASLTMSDIASKTGIGRATLYKYFPDVETIVVAWHERQIGRHLDQLANVRDRLKDPRRRLAAVLETYAMISHEHHAGDRAALLHQGSHAVEARKRLVIFVADLVAEGARSGNFRRDVPPIELAVYCVNALGAASQLPSAVSVRRLIKVTLAGLRTK
jgi:AcrR family transcriptional regulator